MKIQLSEERRYLKKVMNKIHLSVDRSFSLDGLPMDDVATFALISNGETAGIFNLNSVGAIEVLKRLKPNQFSDIVAFTALYRPEPIERGILDSFINRKHGLEPVESILPEMNDILNETFSVLVYHEQVEGLMHFLTGILISQTNALKQTIEVYKLAAFRKSSDILNVQWNIRKLKPIFDFVVEFAPFTYSRFLAAEHALLSYQGAYLKAHFPLEFVSSIAPQSKHRA